MTSYPNKIPYEKDFTIADAWLVLTTWRNSDTYPWMKQRCVNYIAPRAAFCISLITLSVHVIWAFHTKCGVNFQRGGSVVALSAAVLYAVVDWHDPKIAILSGERMKFITFFDWHSRLGIRGLASLLWKLLGDNPGTGLKR